MCIDHRLEFLKLTVRAFILGQSNSHNGLTLKTSDFFEFITQLIKSKYPTQRVCGSVVERRITESGLNSFEELKISFFVPGRKCHSRKVSCQKLA